MPAVSVPRAKFAPLGPESRNVPRIHAGGGGGSACGAGGGGIARAATMETKVGRTHTGHFFRFTY